MSPGLLLPFEWATAAIVILRERIEVVPIHFFSSNCNEYEPIVTKRFCFSYALY